MSDSQAQTGLVSALVDLRLGTVLSASVGGDFELMLEDLAAASSELFATDRVSWDVIFGRLQARDSLLGFQDVVLVSAERVYVLLRSTRDPAIGLVGISTDSRNLGLALAEARNRLRQLEAER
jgi:hypothetical protein